MFRLLGFIIGSAVSILTILLIIGIPEFHLSNPDIDKRRFDEAVEKLKEKSQDARLIAAGMADKMSGKISETIPATPDPMPNPMLNPMPNSEAEMLPSEPFAMDAQSPANPDPTLAMIETMDDIMPRMSDDPRWHAFWNPFRSMIAAQGFVSRLEKVTGLDYRIEKIDTGIYEVSFAYASDMERDLKLSQISAATGLDLPGS